MSVPNYEHLFNPLLEALRKLGGSATIEELESEVSTILALSEKDINELHRGSRTKLSYRLAWARTYLKRYGLLENSARGVWSLTDKGEKTSKVDIKVVQQTVRSLDKKQTGTASFTEDSLVDEWEERLLAELQSVSPAGFERLCQRLLREAGFIDVDVTGRPGDGGIDGIGTIRINLISFRVIFQCKRYKGSISSQQIREFKGTMSGRAERGLFITTSTFTKDARGEANRDGSTPIDLIDGKRLVELMKEYQLGVTVKTTEQIDIQPEWFKSFH